MSPHEDRTDPRGVTIRVHGRVQGVFFRASTRSVARRLGLSGWVRNETDGSVLIEAAGPCEALQAFVDWCRHGPEGARVEAIDLDWHPAGEMPPGFAIRATGA